MMPNKVGDGSQWVLVVGATSGIARALVRELARFRFHLILAARDRSELEVIADDLRVRSSQQVVTLGFDAVRDGVVEGESDAQFWEEVLNLCQGELYGVILCHGVMPSQEKAQQEWKTSRLLIETNYASFLSLLNLSAKYFSGRKEGFLAAIGSVAGDRGRATNSIYGSTKAAVEVLMQGVRQRLSKNNIQVITIKPGPVDTAMTFGQEKLPLKVPPERVARDILRGIRRRKEIVYTPSIWRLIMTVLCLIPEKLWKRLKF